jgi:hypothetical protein
MASRRNDEGNSEGDEAHRARQTPGASGMPRVGHSGGVLSGA